MNLYDSIANYCSLLYGGIASVAAQPLWAVVSTISTTGTTGRMSIPFEGLESLTDSVFELINVNDELGVNSYLSLGMSQAQLEDGKSISKDTAIAPWVLMADIDMAGFAHKDKTLPLPAEDVSRFIIREVEDELGVKISVVHTGGGLHVYIPFNRAIATATIEAWKRYIKAKFNDAGFHLDNLSGAGQQLMRVPGSRNANQGGVRAEWVESYDDVRHELGDIEKRLAALAKPSKDGKPVARESAPTRLTKAGDMSLVGNRLAAAVDVLDFLGNFYPLMLGGTGGVLIRPDGTWNTGETHFHYLPGGNGAVAFWGQTILDATGLTEGNAYDAFRIIITLFCGGNAPLATFAIGHLERETNTTQQWVDAVVEFFTENQTPTQVRSSLPKPKYSKPKAAKTARYTPRRAA